LNQGEDNGIDLGSELNSKLTGKLGIGWTILTGFMIEDYPKDKDYSVIFNNSDNGCYQFIINDLNSKEKDRTFQFRKTGETGFKNTFYTNISPKLHHKYHIALT